MENAGTHPRQDARFLLQSRKAWTALIVRLQFPSRPLHPAAEIIRSCCAILRNQPVGTMPCDSIVAVDCLGKGNFQKDYIFFTDYIFLFFCVFCFFC
jgi:hypothetical protein